MTSKEDEQRPLMCLLHASLFKRLPFTRARRRPDARPLNFRGRVAHLDDRMSRPKRNGHRAAPRRAGPRVIDQPQIFSGLVVRGDAS
eukprot:3791343-Pleurochrysis_carterae.AAC.2